MSAYLTLSIGLAQESIKLSNKILSKWLMTCDSFREDWKLSLSRNFKMKGVSVVFLLIGATLAFPGIERGPRVVGGREATPHEAPYIVSFQVDRAGTGAFSHICGGSILNANWVLGAAHCITEVGLQFTYQVVAGQHDLANESGQEQRRIVADWDIHANFVSGPVVAPFDIMVLRLESPLILTPGVVEAIALPPSAQISSGDATLFGWGSTSSTTTPSFPNILHTVNKPIIAWDLCREVVNAVMDHEPLHASNLCTGPLDTIQSACNGYAIETFLNKN